jgi:hypothetical protein
MTVAMAEATVEDGSSGRQLHRRVRAGAAEAVVTVAVAEVGAVAAAAPRRVVAGGAERKPQENERARGLISGPFPFALDQETPG